MGGGDGHLSTPEPCWRVALDGEDVGDQTLNANVSRSDFIGLYINPLIEFQKKKRKRIVLFSFDSCSLCV